jgi:hypothetical protein
MYRTSYRSIPTSYRSQLNVPRSFLEVACPLTSLRALAYRIGSPFSDWPGPLRSILRGTCVDFAWVLRPFCVDFAWILRPFCVDSLSIFCGFWPCLLTAAGIVSLDVCLVGPPATSNRTSDDENTVGIGCRHRGSSCNWTRDFILRRILPLTYRILGLSTDR